MAGQTKDDLERALTEAQHHITLYELRVHELEAEIARTAAWRRTVVGAVVAVALLAIVVLGAVAFNAVDDAEAAGRGHAESVLG